MATSLPPEATISVLSLAPISRDQVAPFLSTITGRTATTDSVQSGLPWTISNKYYTADVAFQMVHSVSSIHEDVPAVLIVVPRTSRPNTDVVSILKACASRHPGFDVALLVTLQTEAESLPVDEDAWDDLALENGFEWVDVLEDDYDDELSKSQTDDVSGTRTSQTDRHPDSNSSDLDGVARVIAALHAHMWEVMVPHDRTALPQVDDKRSDGSDNEDEDDLSHLAPPALPVPRPYVAQPVSFPDTFLPSLRVKPSPALAGAGVGAGTAGFADDFAPFEEALHSSHTTFPPLSNENEDEAADHKGLYRHAELSFPDSVSSRSRTVDDDGDEVDVDKGDVEELDDMFEQMMAVRREVEGLGFDERREKAEQAMRSMGLLGAGSRTGSVGVGVDQSD